MICLTAGPGTPPGMLIWIVLPLGSGMIEPDGNNDDGD